MAGPDALQSNKPFFNAGINGQNSPVGFVAGVFEKGATKPGCDQAMQGEMPHTPGQAEGAAGQDLSKL